MAAATGDGPPAHRIRREVKDRAMTAGGQFRMSLDSSDLTSSWSAFGRKRTDALHNVTSVIDPKLDGLT